MGNDTSLPLVQVPPGFSTMCIALQYSDGITVLHHDSGTLSTMRQAIIDTWPNGIQREAAICGTGWMFKVKGNNNRMLFQILTVDHISQNESHLTNHAMSK